MAKQYEEKDGFVKIRRYDSVILLYGFQNFQLKRPLFCDEKNGDSFIGGAALDTVLHQYTQG